MFKIKHMEITERIKNLKSDFTNDDWSGMATMIDVEHIACECIVGCHRVEGCNLLSAYIRLTANSNSKRLDIYLREVLFHLDAAELVLT